MAWTLPKSSVLGEFVLRRGLAEVARSTTSRGDAIVRKRPTDSAVAHLACATDVVALATIDRVREGIPALTAATGEGSGA